MDKRVILVLIVSISAIWTSCQNAVKDVDLSGIEVQLNVKRFEKELFSADSVITPAQLASLRSEYGEFTDIFLMNMIRLPDGNDTSLAAGLTSFIRDAEVRDVAAKTDSLYSDISDITADLISFMKHYKYYYPEKQVPQIITYVSAFNYAVITTDSAIGIGLDMFLGPEMPYYAQMGMPKYMFRNFKRAYIVPSVARAVFQSEYEQAMVKEELLSQMLYEGKQLYFTKLMNPEMHDSLVTGYSNAELEWCKANETQIWSYFIEQKLLFNTDPTAYAKYVKEGPGTNGFPEGAPGKIGAWVGWQIINAYMDQHRNTSLTDLLNQKDAQSLLEQSAYKPQK